MITATVTVYRLRHKRDDWCALEARLDDVESDGDQPFDVGSTIDITGELTAHDPQAGDKLIVFGEPKTNKYGTSLAASQAIKVLKADLADVEAFLGRVPWIGPIQSRNLCARLGRSVIDTLDAGETSQVANTLGVDDAVAEQICTSYRLATALTDAWQWLQKYPLRTHEKAKIISALGEKTRTTLEANPYDLDKAGFAFREADELALQSFGLQPDDPRRLRAGARAALAEIAAEWGHTAVPTKLLLNEGALNRTAKRATDFCTSELRQGLVFLREAGKLDLVRDDKGRQRMQLPYHASAERMIADGCSRLLAAFSPPQDVEIEASGPLSDEQAAGVRMLLSVGAGVLTGGPGTGKTSTIKALIATAKKLGRTVRLLAPTAQAASRMTEATGVEASTVHRAIANLTATRQPFFPESIVVVDEASMLDTEVASWVTGAVRDGSSVVFVGDVDQLPSVAAGAVLHDLIEGGLPTARLTQIFRQAADCGIPHVCRAVRDGDSSIKSLTSPDVQLVRENDPDRIAWQIVQVVATALRTPPKNGAKVKRRAFSLDEIQVLSPQRKGPCGTYVLNKALQEKLNPIGQACVYIRHGHRMGPNDKVIHKKNNTTLDVYNGMVGRCTVVDFRGFKHEGRQVVALVEYPNRPKPVGYAKNDLRELDLAYALTVHSAQGSQYPCVVAPVHETVGFMLTQRLLYTLISRASEFALMFGTRDALTKCPSNNRGQVRFTGLQTYLRADNDGQKKPEEGKENET